MTLQLPIASARVFSSVATAGKQFSRKFSVTRKNNMRYVQYKLKSGGQQHLGAQLSPGGDIIDISAVDSTIPNNLVDFLKAGPSTYEKSKR